MGGDADTGEWRKDGTEREGNENLPRQKVRDSIRIFACKKKLHPAQEREKKP